MFILEVGCLGYCPYSFLHCFEALGLPKSAARQIRSEASKPPFAHRMYFSSQSHADLGVSSCSLPNHAHVAIVSYSRLFLSSFALPFPFRTVRTPRQIVSFPNIHATPLAFRILQLSDIHRTQCVLQFFARFPQEQITEQPVGCALSLLCYVDSTIRVRVVDWWISVSNLQLAALTF